MLRAVPLLAFAAAVCLLVPTGRASLYQPDDPMVVPVSSTGDGSALPFDEFKRQFATLSNQSNPALTRVKKEEKTDREKQLDRVTLRKKARGKSPADDVALAADLIRLGNNKPLYVNEAIELLAPRTRDRNPNYFVFTTIAISYAARGDWNEAAENQLAALTDTEMPNELPGLSPSRRSWLARLDRDYVLPYYQFHVTELRKKTPPESEDATPLFPVPQRGQPHVPIRFVNEAGTYEPGKLAASERAKLPTDAIAVVQQMLLWYPWDSQLYWLLAELYAANGQFSYAVAIMDECSWGRQYTNRKIMMDHRAALRPLAEAEAKQRADAEAALSGVTPTTNDGDDAAPPADKSVPIDLSAVWIYFGVVAVIVVLAVARAVTRRSRRVRGMSR